MSTYRLTVIAKDNSSLAEVKEAIASQGAPVASQTDHGERKFVYPIQKLDHGLFVSYTLESEPAKIAGLEKNVREVDGVLRTLLIHWSPTLAKPAPVKLKKDQEPIIEKKPKEEETEKPKAGRKKIGQKPKAKEKVTEKTDEQRLKELDEKLAEILKS
jgi:ribosomal protein S6